jgi:heme exporter protein CcmD
VTALLAMDDAGFIIGSYAVTFAAVGVFAWRMLRQARRLADRIEDDQKYWT